MLWKTHLAIGLAVALFFAAKVTHPFIFIPVVLFSSLFPDIDSSFSRLGRKPVFIPVQIVSSHRGIVHSYTLAVFLSLILASFYPILALPFFLGYSFHLFADSFTQQGIKPFWPFKGVSKGAVSVGGKSDKIIFYTFVIIDAVLLGSFVYGFL